MESAVRRIGVFTSGGDAPGMNAAIRAVVRTSLHLGIECIGIRRGYHGLINGDIARLDFESVSDISRRGGTMLYSARSREFIGEDIRLDTVSINDEESIADLLEFYMGDNTIDRQNFIRQNLKSEEELDDINI